MLINGQIDIMKESHKSFSKFIAKFKESENNMLYDSVLEHLKNFIEKELDITPGQKHKERLDYEYLIKEHYMNNIYFYDTETKELKQINSAEFGQYESDSRYVIVVKNIELVN